MGVTVTRIERKIWNVDRGSFTATGEATDIDIDSLEPTTERPPVSGGRFLKGPIPWSWITAAAALPGHALLVGLCIWRLAGATKSHTVSLGNSDLKPLGIDRAAKSRALQALETAGLIAVARRRARFPIVTLPDAHVYPRKRSPRQVAVNTKHRRRQRSITAYPRPRSDHRL